MSDWFGTWLYPPVWIVQKGERSFSEADYGYCAHVAVRLRYRGSPIFISRDGCIVAPARRHADAADLFNEVFFLLNLGGSRFDGLRTYDVWLVGHPTEPNSESILGIGGSSATYRGYLAWARGTGVEPRDWVPPKHVVNSVAKYRKLLEARDHPPLLETVLDAWSATRTGQYLQGLLLSWLVIEQFLEDLWESYVSGRVKSKERRKNLGQGREWTAYVKLETLQMAGLLSETWYQKMNTFRKRRNDVLHKAKPADPHIATQAFEFALSRFIEGLRDHRR